MIDNIGEAVEDLLKMQKLSIIDNFAEENLFESIWIIVSNNISKLIVRSGVMNAKMNILRELWTLYDNC